LLDESGKKEERIIRTNNQFYAQNCYYIKWRREKGTN